MQMKIRFRDLKPQDFDRCIEIRGMTRDNPIPAEILKEFGVTKDAWVPLVKDKRIIGVVAESRDEVVGFCSGDAKTGEVLVLALLPAYEGYGLGKNMLVLVADKLLSFGIDKLWLAASPNPEIRAHGFYRHLGWAPTGMIDKNKDEVLEYNKA
jgi:ribosomal protein S18 acetylase RimI-like enzyme